MNLRVVNPKQVLIAVNEPMTLYDLENMLHVFAKIKSIPQYKINFTKYNDLNVTIATCRENTKFLHQDIFNKLTSESQIMRYMHSLQLKDISLVNSMISLGSCTLKLNAATEMVNL